LPRPSKSLRRARSQFASSVLYSPAFRAKSPFLKANGRTNDFESDDERLLHRTSASMHLNMFITATTRMRRYLDCVTLSFSGPPEPEAE
jgi:hypothetical protein